MKVDEEGETDDMEAALRRLDRELRELEIENMKLDLKLLDQKMKLGPWRVAVTVVVVLAAMLWMAVFLIWLLDLGPHRPA